jgi:hypothetical protein
MLDHLRRPRGEDWPGLSGPAVWRAWKAAQDAWCAEHGWTRRQVLGYRHPSWIVRGWADEPPPGE